MKNLLYKLGESDSVKIGVYELTGGVAGLLMSIWAIYNKSLKMSVVDLFDLICPLFFLFSIFCGILCLNNKKNALYFSLVNQMLQIISFSFMGLRYKYVAGLYFDMGVNIGDSMHLQFGMGIPTFNLFFYSPKNITTFDINWIAVIVAYWIIKLQEFSKVKSAYMEADSILEK